MVAHIAQQLDGWWGGVLDPFDGYGVLLAIVVIGLLAGIASHAGREPWMAGSTFVVGVLGGIVAAAAGLQTSRFETVVIGAALVGAGLITVDPPRISNSLLYTSLVMGALAGMTIGSDPVHQIGARFVLGLLFTIGVVLACTAFTGHAIGRSVAARRSVAAVACLAAIGLLVG